VLRGAAGVERDVDGVLIGHGPRSAKLSLSLCWTLALTTKVPIASGLGGLSGRSWASTPDTNTASADAIAISASNSGRRRLLRMDSL